MNWVRFVVALLVTLPVSEYAEPAVAQEAQPGTGVSLGPTPRALVPTALEVADSLANASDLEGAYAVLSVRLDVVPDDVEALILALQTAMALGIMGGDAPTRLRWLRIAEAQGRALLPLKPHDPEVLAWAAASRGRLAMAEDGARTVVRLAQEVWALTDTLLAMAPDHPLGNHVRGKLHQEAMRLSRFKRFFARVFFGFDAAGMASWDGAETHLERAVAQDPGMILFFMDLGDTYRYQGKTEAAAATYRAGLALPDRLPVDEHLKGLLRRRLQRLEDREAGTS